MKLKIQDTFLILFGAAFLFYVTIFIFTGTNLLSRDRWGALIFVTFISFFISGIGRIEP